MDYDCCVEKLFDWIDSIIICDFYFVNFNFVIDMVCVVIVIYFWWCFIFEIEWIFNVGIIVYDMVNIDCIVYSKVNILCDMSSRKIEFYFWNWDFNNCLGNYGNIWIN